MFPKIFDIVNEKVVINENCLLIPELKAIHDEYEDPIPAFTFLHYRFDPKSPYHNLIENEKDDLIFNDFPGDYTLEDEVMIAAIDKLSKLYLTPTYRYYLDNKVLLEKIGAFGKNASVSTGRDGNVNALLSQIRSVGKTIMEFKQLEKVVQQELSEGAGKVRGDKKLAYDQE